MLLSYHINLVKLKMFWLSKILIVTYNLGWKEYILYYYTTIVYTILTTKKKKESGGSRDGLLLLLLRRPSDSTTPAQGDHDPCVVLLP
jgi:hypothetical protein